MAVGPVKPLQGRIFDGLADGPGSAMVDHPSLEEPDDHLREGVVLGVVRHLVRQESIQLHIRVEVKGIGLLSNPIVD